jgi:hypothetical protein
MGGDFGFQAGLEPIQEAIDYPGRVGPRTAAGSEDDGASGQGVGKSIGRAEGSVTPIGACSGSSTTDVVCGERLGQRRPPAFRSGKVGVHRLCNASAPSVVQRPSTVLVLATVSDRTFFPGLAYVSMGSSSDDSSAFSTRLILRPRPGFLNMEKLTA